MKYGLILTSPTIQGQMDMAAKADGAGFDSVWTIEFFNQHGLVRLAAVATATKNVRLGSAIAYAFMRTPMLAATAAMDIDEISGGRMVLGLGTGTKSMNERWYSMPFEGAPAPRVKDAIGLVRAAFAAKDGGGLKYEGPFYNVSIPQFSRPGAVRSEIPVYLAAVNQGMIRAAASVADGLVCHPIFTRKYMEEIVNPILAGSACQLMPYVITSIHKDAGKARDEARNQIAFYYTTRLYHSVLVPHGWEHIGEEIAVAFKKGDFGAMSRAVPDEMVDAIALTGTEDEVKEKVSRWSALSDQMIFYSPSVGMKPDRVTENMEAIIDTFGEN